MTIKDALDYISFSISEGYVNEDFFEGMSDRDKVEWATREMERGDDEANRNED